LPSFEFIKSFNLTFEQDKHLLRGFVLPQRKDGA